MSAKWILLVMEDSAFRMESICYAMNLAKRIDCSISVLMLASNTDHENERLISDQEIVKKVIDMIEAEGINTEGTFRYGDKASGLLKHLASFSSFSAIIWAGKEKITSGHNMKKPDHWLAKIETTIRCPVVSPTKKYKNKKT